MKKEYLEAGKIVTTHGIRGEVKIMPYTDYPELLCEFDRLFIGKEHKEIIIERSRVFKDMVIAKIEGTDSPEDAAKLRNKILFMHRDDWSLKMIHTLFRILSAWKCMTPIRTSYTERSPMFCKRVQTTSM